MGQQGGGEANSFFPLRGGKFPRGGGGGVNFPRPGFCFRGRGESLKGNGGEGEAHFHLGGGGGGEIYFFPGFFKTPSGPKGGHGKKAHHFVGVGPQEKNFF